ncbi:hypothetical protein [Desulfosporosinus youngiae]|uniref:hypothetical protein n=1 Tax=Desulfosporosinus youngiae TaxID=339862 RepID=UPI0002FD6779|nr:hypothetical protein [Desulfosporosinus youngiae]
MAEVDRNGKAGRESQEQTSASPFLTLSPGLAFRQSRQEKGGKLLIFRAKIPYSNNCVR